MNERAVVTIGIERHMYYVNDRPTTPATPSLAGAPRRASLRNAALGREIALQIATTFLGTSSGGAASVWSARTKKLYKMEENARRIWFLEETVSLVPSLGPFRRVHSTHWRHREKMLVSPSLNRTRNDRRLVYCTAEEEGNQPCKATPGPPYHPAGAISRSLPYTFLLKKKEKEN